jgi:hypothetical protein
VAEHRRLFHASGQRLGGERRVRRVLLRIRRGWRPDPMWWLVIMGAGDVHLLRVNLRAGLHSYAGVTGFSFFFAIRVLLGGRQPRRRQDVGGGRGHR